MAITVTTTIARVTPGSTPTATTTTASFTPALGEILVACVSFDNTNTTAVTISDTSGGTWTQVRSDGNADAPTGSNIITVIATRPVPSSASMTVTMVSTGAFFTSAKVYRVSAPGTLAVGATGHGGSSTANLTATAFTSTVASSVMLVAAGSLLASTTASSSDLTVDAGFNSGLDDLVSAGGFKTLGAPGSQSFNVSATFSTPGWHWAAVEITESTVSFSPGLALDTFSGPFAISPLGLGLPSMLAPGAAGSDQVPVQLSAYQAAVAADGPSVWWQLEETSGAFVDSIAGISAPVTGSVTQHTAGIASPFAATWSNSVLSYAEAAQNAIFVPTTITVEALINIASTSGNSRIVQNGADNSWVLLYDAGQLKFIVQGLAAATATWAPDGKNHHVVGTYNGTGLAVIYVDGVQAGFQQGTGTGGPATTVNPLRIGGKPTGVTASDCWNGILDEVAIYPAVLSQASIAAHTTAAGLESAAMFVSAGLSAAGVVGAVGAATVAVTAGITAAGVVGVVGNATVTTTAGITTAATVGAVGSASLTTTAGLTASGVVGKVGQATLTVTAGMVADAGALTGGSSLTTTAGLTASGVAGAVGAASFTSTAGLTATGGPLGVVGAASLTATAGLTASGVVGKVGQATVTTTAGVVAGAGGSATLTTTAGITAAGVVGAVGAATLTATGAVATAATLGVVGQAALTATAGLTAAGILAGSGTASLTTTASVAAVGVVGVVGAASLTTTAGVVAGAGGTSSLATVAGLTAAGAVGKFGSASLTATAGMVAVRLIVRAGQATAGAHPGPSSTGTERVSVGATSGGRSGATGTGTDRPTAGATSGNHPTPGAEGVQT